MSEKFLYKLDKLAIKKDLERKYKNGKISYNMIQHKWLINDLPIDEYLWKQKYTILNPIYLVPLTVQIIEKLHE